MKRTLIILSAVIVVAGIGAAIYFYIAGKEPAVTVAPNPSLPVAGDAPFTVVGSGPDDEMQAPTGAPETVTKRLSQVSAGPVVPGAVAAYVSSDVGTTTGASGTNIFFIERQSGHVFSYGVETGTLTRTSNRTIPGIQEAFWLPDASRAFVRYLSGSNFEVINTYTLLANGEAGSFLPQNLDAIDVSSSTVLTLASSDTGSVGSIERANGTGAKTVFSTPLSSLRASFAGGTSYLVTTKASGRIDGYAFLVDGEGRFSRVAGPLRGLAAKASPRGNWVLVSATSGTGMTTALVDTKTRETIALPLGTIADKCVWAPDETAVYCGVPVRPSNGTYPDDWYQGAARFSDRIWKIDVVGRFAQLTLDFSKETEQSLDATALALDPQARVLVFMNKNDGSLWSYQL